ncbi:hypothetical protein [Litoribacillus peritrichatus]|uniref:Uncharacterized protein n=1 Tax=Litoribacillus peritrichatus TaxID=718191 RepID=A0ABP7MNI2_9GAMM
MSNPATPADNQLHTLLDLHVQHELAGFETDTFINWVQQESGPLFEWFKTTNLKQWVTPEQIKQIIHRNVVEQEIPGAIAEIAGEAATRLFTSEKHRNTQLNEVITAHQFEEFVDKLLELEQQRIDGLDHIIDLPIYGDLISSVVYQAITRYIYESNVLTKKVPGVSSVLKMSRAVVNKTAPKLGGAVEESVKRYITNNLDFILEQSKSFLEFSITEEQLKASAMDLWDIYEHKTLGEIQQGMDSIDLSEFVVLGYEFWLRYRTTEHFKDNYELIVDYLFETYADENLSTLLEDFMITPERLLTEVEHIAPLALNTLKESGQLEGLIRRRLESFYCSEVATSALQ